MKCVSCSLHSCQPVKTKSRDTFVKKSGICGSKVGTFPYKVNTFPYMVIIDNICIRWRDKRIEILKSLEGQPLKKWDCPSEIGTVGNYEFSQLLPHRIITVIYC